jgi:hypothetical protein
MTEFVLFLKVMQFRKNFLFFPLIGNIVTHYSFLPHTHETKCCFLLHCSGKSVYFILNVVAPISTPKCYWIEEEDLLIRMRYVYSAHSIVKIITY